MEERWFVPDPGRLPGMLGNGSGISGWRAGCRQKLKSTGAPPALARRILEEDGPAVSRHIVFLKKGGSDYPFNLLNQPASI
ncbi:MAG TPA: hypothetical protein PK728_04190 [Bacillota bacterium]|nr:hypothetical protein [Bacillota bacterium]